jgi:hypothetical protein
VAAAAAAADAAAAAEAALAPEAVLVLDMAVAAAEAAEAAAAAAGEAAAAAAAAGAAAACPGEAASSARVEQFPIYVDGLSAERRFSRPENSIGAVRPAGRGPAGRCMSTQRPFLTATSSLSPSREDHPSL